MCPASPDSAEMPGDGAPSGVAENPFASRFVRPGSIPFHFSNGWDIGQVVGQLKACRWRGAIVGPHGSGKSTLLAHLDTEIRRQLPGAQLARIPGDGLPRKVVRQTKSPSTTILLVDGFDGLSLWRRWLLRRQCVRRGYGLIVTSHGPVGLPVLLATSTSPDLILQIAGQLAGAEFANTQEGLIRESIATHGGNMREVLFDLYDLHERTSRGKRTEHGASGGGGANPHGSREQGQLDRGARWAGVT